MASRLSKNYYLSIAGLIGFTLVALKAATILLAPEQLYFFGVSIPADYANNAYLQDQNLRFCLFLLVSYAIFTSYCVIAETTNISLPFMLSVLLLFLLLSILSAVLTLSTPLAEPVSTSYRYWPIWVINSLAELSIAVLALIGIKGLWKNLTAKINYQQNIVMISAMVIAFSITQFYVPDSYMDCSLALMKQYKELLTQLPYELDDLISMFWFSLPKYVILFTISIALLAKLGHGRHFVYALLLSFILLQFVLKQLPIISTLVIGSTTKVSQIILLSNSFAIGLLVVMVGCLSNTRSKNLGTGKV
ncbi:hypothetical protein L2747_12515 [Shewanella marinintestina]|uniref:hypothetical protein n=1 Tax=Shewanella marinintestina TaxID=190305 RepID=UPI0020102CBC|nr:hypothetical protein [Shewanella marinintestina]MCL1146822.1 hypothetical protein [Shewanella marinintestina]